MKTHPLLEDMYSWNVWPSELSGQPCGRTSGVWHVAGIGALTLRCFIQKGGRKQTLA